MPNDKRLNDLWKRKDDYIKSRLDWLNKKVDGSQQILLNNLSSGFAGEFAVDEFGKLKATTRNMRLAVKMDQFFDVLDKETLRKVNTQYGQDMLKLTPLNERYYNTLIPDARDVITSISEKVGFIEAAIGIKDGTILKGGYLDNITKMPEVRQQLKNYVVQSVNNKKGFSEYLRGMKEIVVGTKTRDGALERYYKQFAYDTFNQTDAAINKHYADSLNLTWFVYSGGTIGTSRAFCIKRSQKVFNTKETETWKCDSTLIGKPKGVRCDSRYNALIERGRWNCRHTLRYITSEMACDMGRKDACDVAEFTEATSIKEAEEFAVNSEFAKKVDYSNLTVDEANAINRTLRGYKEQYGITLEDINVTNKGGLSAVADAQMIQGVGRMGFDVKSMRRAFKDRISNKESLNRRISGYRKELKEAKALGWEDDVAKLDNKIRQLEDKINNSPEYYSFADSAGSYDDYIKYVTDHEYTHILQGYEPILHGQTRLEIASYYSDIKASTKLFNKYYTDYAGSNWDEFWAEASAMHKNGLLKDPQMIKLLNKINADGKNIVQ